MLENKKDIIDIFGEIGLNKYESEAYIALLQNPNISAYEISKNSGVPQSKIYETAKNLVFKGLAVAEGTNPIRYSPFPIEEFLDCYKKSVDESVSFLKENLKGLNEQPKIDYMWHFEGENQIISKMKSIVNEVEDNLYLELWDCELEMLSDELRTAEDRGVKILIVLYGKEKFDIGKIYYHEMEGMEDDAEKFGRWLTIVKDGKESLFGVFKLNHNYAVWTQNKSFMLMAENFISHDIFIAEIYKKYKDLLNKEFGPNFKRIRDIITIG